MRGKRHIRIGMIVEDQYCDAYRELTRKVEPDRVRGYPIRKKKSIPATEKLNTWIKEARDKFDFVFVLADLDTPMHNKDPEYFRNLQRICKKEGAALLIVKVELESWILTDVNCIARWKKSKAPLKIYPNTARKPLEPKDEILGIVSRLSRGKRKVRTFNPQWIAEIAKHFEFNDDTLTRNSSLRCFYDLVKGCCGSDGRKYFSAYPQESHCNSQEIPD